MGFSKSSPKREVYSNKTIPQKIRIDNLHNFTSKAAGKKRTQRPQNLQKERIINIIAEINEKEMKEAIAKINKIKADSPRR